MSTAGRSGDAAAKAGQIRASTDRIKTAVVGASLGGEAVLTLAGYDSAEDRRAARVIVRIAGCLGAGCEDCLTVLRALGLAPDPVVGTATNDLGIRRQERRGAVVVPP
jgi:hypothetical protein